MLNAGVINSIQSKYKLPVGYGRATRPCAVRTYLFLDHQQAKLRCIHWQATFKMQILLVLYALLCIFFGPTPRYIIDSKDSTNLGICSLSVNCQVNDLL